VQIIAIDEQDRWARELNDVDDVERLLPGTLDAIREWFRTYKIPDGKPENK
jgi:inorganic pyrophosphatase